MKIRLSREEFAKYKAMSLDEKVAFIRGRARAKADESIARIKDKPIRLFPYFVAIVLVLYGVGFSHTAKVLGLVNMNEYVCCESCGTYHRADRVQRYQISHSEIGANVFEEDVCCPVCGSTDIADAHLCPLCEAPTHRSVLCDRCLGEVGVMYDKFVDAVQKRWVEVTRSDVAEILTEVIDEL